MDSERWQRIETVFDAALDLDPSRWDTFLDDHCRDDLALRAEVAALLAAHVPPTTPAAARKAGLLPGLWRWRRAIIAGVLVLVIAALVASLRTTASEKDAALQRSQLAEADARGSRSEAYVNALAAAEASIRAHQIDDARIRLERTPEDLRGWEWHHLWRRLDRSLYAIPAHKRDVTRIAFTHGGSFFATASLDRTIGLWRTETGDSVHRVGPFGSGVESIAVHPSDTTIAAGLSDGTVLVMNSTTGAERARFSGKGRATVAFNPEGSRLAAAFHDGKVTEWRMDTLKPTGTIDAGGALVCLTYSRDGKYIITGDDSGHAKIWDARTRRRIAAITAHDRRIMDMAAGDGGLFATASLDHAVKVWRISDRSLVTTFRGHDDAVTGVAFQPGGRQIVSAGADRRILRWSVATGSIVAELHGDDAARATAIDPTSGRIAAGGADGVVRMWPESADDVRTFRDPDDAALQSAASHARVSRDGTMLACAANRLEIDLWNAESGEHVARIETGRADYPTRVAFSPSGSHLFAGDRGGNVIVFDPIERRRLLAFSAHTAAVQGLDVSPDGAVLVSAAADSTMKFWDARTLAPRGEFRGLTGAVTKVVFAPDSTLATACTDHTIRLWNATTGDTLRVFRGHGAPVLDLAFSPNGARIVSVAKDGGVRMWNTKTGADLGPLEAGRAGAACFTPDGTRIVLGGPDPVLRVIDIASGREVARLYGHTGRILSLEASPLHDAVVSASYDGTVRLWDAK